MDNNKVICPCCSYSENLPSSQECELCGTTWKHEKSTGKISLSNQVAKSTLADKLLLEPKKLNSLANRQELSQEQRQASSTKVKKNWFLFDYANVPSRSTFQLFCLIILANLLMAIVLGGGYLLWQRWDRFNNISGSNSRSSSSKLYQRVEPDSQIQSDSETEFHRTMQEVPNVPKGLFNYGGATCFAALTKYGMNEAIALAHPEYQLRYTEPLNSKPGCSTGIDMLLDSQLSFAQNGRPLQDSEYAKAKERNLTLKQIPVAIDGIVFFVHPQVPVEELSINQLRDIFLGKITNWQQVGGSDLPIVAISQDPKVHITINSLLENGEKLGEQVKIVRDYTTAMREVGNTPGSISYSSAAIARGQQTIRGLGLATSDSTKYVLPFTKDGQVNLNAFRSNSYPLTRRLFVVVREDGTIEEEAGIAYANLLLTNEGQQIIEQAGFVPLYE
jgi:phosphate transport system substrate-binding protein